MYVITKSARVSTRGPRLYSFVGKSSDDKPTAEEKPDMALGSDFYEMDTGKLFMYDDETETWLKQ